MLPTSDKKQNYIDVIETTGGLCQCRTGMPLCSFCQLATKNRTMDGDNRRDGAVAVVECRWVGSMNFFKMNVKNLVGLSL